MRGEVDPAWCGDISITEYIEDIGSIFFQKGGHLRIHGLGKLRGEEKKIERLLGGMLVNGPERCHFGFAVKSEP